MSSAHSGKPESPTGPAGHARGKGRENPTLPNRRILKRFQKKKINSQSKATRRRGAAEDGGADCHERRVAEAFQGLFCSPELQHGSYF